MERGHGSIFKQIKIVDNIVVTISRNQKILEKLHR